jgi:hypothetical protein
MSRRQHYRSPEDAASALGRLLHAGAAPSAEPTADDPGARERLLRAVSSRDSAASHRARLGRWLMAAGIALLIGVFAWHERAGTPLTFAVDGTPRTDGATIETVANHSAAMRFSDGSTFQVEPGAQLRVDSSTSRGSRLSLLNGTTVVHVVHRQESAWTLHAGPFEIRVTGTRFAARWDAAQRRLSVDLYDGSVQVAGTSLDAPISVRAGQRLEAGTSAGNWLLTSLDGPGPEVAPAPANAPSAIVALAPSSSVTPSPPVPPIVHGPQASDWSALLERADFDGIVREANQLGVEHCLSSCAARDVRILADAARYSGRLELAERSLLALRKRGPTDSTTAAFLLARLAEARADSKGALRWYETYLTEAPGGVYGAEALAGKMRMLLQTGDGAESRQVAEAYLSRFPNGVAAATARKILANVRIP